MKDLLSQNGRACLLILLSPCIQMTISNKLVTCFLCVIGPWLLCLHGSLPLYLLQVNIACKYCCCATLVWAHTKSCENDMLMAYCNGTERAVTGIKDVSENVPLSENMVAVTRLSSNMLFSVRRQTYLSHYNHICRDQLAFSANKFIIISIEIASDCLFQIKYHDVTAIVVQHINIYTFLCNIHFIGNLIVLLPIISV